MAEECDENESHFELNDKREGERLTIYGEKPNGLLLGLHRLSDLADS